MKAILEILRKEFLLDFRQMASVASILAYLISVLFAISFLFKNKHTALSYSAVFLIIFLFTSILASYRNFLKENADSGLFNYVYYSPIQYITGKIVYSIILNLLISILLTLLMIFLNGKLIENYYLFTINIIGLSVGLGSLLTLMGSIASKTDGNFALMSIMSFPLLLPLLIISAKLNIASIQDIPLSMNIKYIISIFSLDGIILALSFILFPQIWTE